MERRGSRTILTGPRARVAEAAFLIAGFTAACQPGTAVDTQKPTIAPTENPTPSLMVSPSASTEASPSPLVTPTPTLEVTPSPTMEVTPSPEIKTMQGLIESKHPNVQLADVKDEITKLSKTDAYKNSPYGASILPRFNDCSNKNKPFGDRTQACYLAVSGLYALYQDTGDIKYYNASLDAYNYADHNLPKDSIDWINQRLEQHY